MNFGPALAELLEARTGEKVSVELFEDQSRQLPRRSGNSIAAENAPAVKHYSPKELLPPTTASLFSDVTPEIVYGHRFHAKTVTAIGRIEEGTKKCVIWGEVFHYEKVEKANCDIITAGISDGTGSICLKWLIRPNQKKPRQFACGEMLVVNVLHSKRRAKAAAGKARKRSNACCIARFRNAARGCFCRRGV